MSFQTRDEFINAQSSEKVTLVHIEATTRLVNWQAFGGGIYYKDTTGFVVNTALDTTELSMVTSVGAMTAGSFYYDIQAGRLYVWNVASADPNSNEMVITYRYFYSDAPVTASWNLENAGDYVYYDARIIKSPGYKHKIGIDQNLTSLVGSGDLVLNNNDGGFDNIFDTVFFENQRVYVYSWNRDLDFDQSKIMFKGRITNKTYSSESISFKIKDSIFDLSQAIPQSMYSSGDNVNDSTIGDYKRWVYGRVDGMKLQSVDQIKDGYQLTGTLSGTANSTTITGSGTSFLSEVSPSDSLTIGTQEFTVDSITSDTSLEISEESESTFTGLTATILPTIPTISKNRVFFVTGHAGAQLTKTVSEVIQLNRVKLNSTTGLLVGDYVEFAGGDRVQIKSITTDNIIVLQQNLLSIPSVSSNVTRQPVQSVSVGTSTISFSDFTIANSSSEMKITLSNNTEFNLAKVVSLSPSFTFTNGSRTVTSGSGEDLTIFIKPRDWIKPDNVSYTTYYEVLQVTPTTVVLRTAFADANITTTGSLKSPDYIGDDTIVCADVLGRTVDNTTTGTWITTAPEVINDLLSEIGITDINSSSFTQGAIDSPQLISLAIPLNPGSSLTTVKDVVDLLNNSTRSSLTLDNNLDIKYKTLFAKVADDIPIISDRDVLDWSIKATNGNIYGKSVINYRHRDYDKFSLDSANSVVEYTSNFVSNYIKTDKTSNIDVYLYNTSEAQTRAHREIYYSRLSRAEITINSDLRLDIHEIGDSVKLDFRRLYKRLGNSSDTGKIAVVIGKTVTGNRVSLILSDLGNIFNSSSIITPNSAVDYATSTDAEKIKRGFITDAQGIIYDLDDTSNIHLIS